MRFSRRRLLEGAAGIAALAGLSQLPACKPEGTPAATGPFRHGVASGDPTPEAVILWTRVTQEGGATGPVDVTWEIARDVAFSAIVARGTVTTDAERDFTVKIDATGLEPGVHYFYRFRGLGVVSPIGRTKTAPRVASQLRFALVSCSNYAMGYFHVYASIAKRADIDAVVHLGDYIYEYGDGDYGDERPSLPTNELRTLADYRARYGQYRQDVDLQELHRQHPFITTWDDHEVADNAFKDGAGEHSADEGPYIDRKRAAFRAYAEWMPIRGDLADGKIWRALRYGDLADLIVLDTRHWGKEQQTGDDDPARNAEGRQILGIDQEAWLFEELRSSKAQWKVVCQQVLMSPLPQYLNTDQWDGYPKARDRFYDAIEKNAVKNVVVLTGDIHASFANDLAKRPLEPGGYDPSNGRGSLAVELVTPAVTSETPSKPKDGSALLAENPWMKHVDLDRHGYVLLDLDAARAQGSFFYVKDVESRNGQDAIFDKALMTSSGESFLRDAAAPAGDRPGTTPLAPLALGAPASAAERRRTLPARVATRRHEPFGKLRKAPLPGAAGAGSGPEGVDGCSA
jgi:alkaline phosphatase D